MTMTAAYAPPRDFNAKFRRRMTQARAAKPAVLRFDRPILSVCFDDFPKNAGAAGARIVERHGGRATFFAAAGMAERDGPCGPGFEAGDIARLAAAGHEIGCHTFAHQDCTRRDVYDTLLDIARNRDALTEMGCALPLRALAYPYGETTFELKQSLPPRFGCARGILPGLNAGRVDLAQLRAFPLFGAGALARTYAALARAAKRNAWMIAFTHDVAEDASPWGTTPEALDAFLTAARTAGLTIAPVSRALEMAR